MDIADAFYHQHSMAWLNHSGITTPQPFSDKAADWLRTFGGGLLTTCGLSHVGGPEKDEHGERGVHGHISNTPAEIVSIIQPDPARGQYEMSITGIMKESTIFGPNLELKRTLSSVLGKSSIRITDEVMNKGNTAAPHMLLYHCNLGWPLADEGSQLLWKGKMFKKDANGDLHPYNNNDDMRTCPAVQPAHNGSGEDLIIIEPEKDASGNGRCGLYNPALGFALSFSFPTSTLPWISNWRHWAKGEYVTGLEPGTHPPIGQAKARQEKTLIMLEPGETKQYVLDMDIVSDNDEIKTMLDQFK